MSATSQIIQELPIFELDFLVKRQYNNYITNKNQGNSYMYTFDIWVQVSPGVSTHTRLSADNSLVARQLAESMYGRGNVLNVTQING